MQRLVMLLGFALAFTVMANAGEKFSSKGWISDSGCAAKGAKAAHKACAIKCVKENDAKWVFVDSATKAVHAIHNQDAVSEANVGQEVTLEGKVKEDKSIHVGSIT